jgi:hypothetical protein
MGKPSGSTIIAKSQSPSEEIAKAFAAGVVRKSCPLYPRKRTSSGGGDSCSAPMSDIGLYDSLKIASGEDVFNVRPLAWF